MYILIFTVVSYIPFVESLLKVNTIEEYGMFKIQCPETKPVLETINNITHASLKLNRIRRPEESGYFSISTGSTRSPARAQ